MCSLYKTFVFIFTLNVLGCGGGGGAPAVVSSDNEESSVGVTSPAYGKETEETDAAENEESQASGKEKFADPFSSSVLQYEVTDGKTGKVTTDTETLLTYPEMEYFYFENDNVVFDLTLQGKPKKRSELRQYPEWSVAGNHRMTATLRLSDSTINEYTWMQLHRKEKTSVKPPLRLTWAKAQSIGGKVYQDYLVAVFYHEKTGYKKVPLVPRTGQEIQAELRVYNHQVFISLNGNLVHVENVSDWADYKCYFKAGLYLSGSAAAEGRARVSMSQLAYSHQ